MTERMKSEHTQRILKLRGVIKHGVGRDGVELVLGERLEGPPAVEDVTGPVEVTVDAAAEVTLDLGHGVLGVCRGRPVGHQLIARAAYQVGSVCWALVAVCSWGSALSSLGVSHNYSAFIGFVVNVPARWGVVFLI